MQERGLAGESHGACPGPDAEPWLPWSWGIELGCKALFHALHLDTLRLKRALSPYHLLRKCSNHWAVLIKAGGRSSRCLARKLADGERGGVTVLLVHARQALPTQHLLGCSPQHCMDLPAPTGAIWDAHISKKPSP